MRVAFGLAGLALSVVAIGACDEPHYKDVDALTCAAYLPHLAEARSEMRVSIDAAQLEAAGASWLAFAAQKYSESELSQFMSESASWVENTSAADLETISTTCVANAPSSRA